jgi:hypothetical protein
MEVDTTTAAPCAVPITSLKDLLMETYRVADTDDIARDDALIKIIKARHYWPALQVKPFYGYPMLTLLHVTYSTCNERKDIHHGYNLKQLYDECRSVVLDLSKDIDETIVVTFATNIPERVTIDQYKSNAQTSDVLYECMEGTMVYVYYHQDRWHFSTSSCPSIDRSKYFNPTKTHGRMLDEALERLTFPEDIVDDEDEDMTTSMGLGLRDKFTSCLDANNSYAFVLVHYENTKTMIGKYDRFLGAQYASLFHIYTKNRNTLINADLSSMPLVTYGILYPRAFPDAPAAIDYLNDPYTISYGVMVQRADGTMWKVSPTQVMQEESENLGHPNVWYNMLWVYMQHKQHFKVNDYLEKYCPYMDPIVDNLGRCLSPTYVIHTVMMTLRDILYDLYRQTTRYYIQYKIFKMDKEKDAQLPPILRFHVAQLRNIQVSVNHYDRYVNKQTVFHYMTRHSTIKDLKRLISYMVTQNTFYLTPNAAVCFSTMASCMGN